MLEKSGSAFRPETIFAAQTGSLLFGGHIGGGFGWTLALICIAGLALVGWKVSYGRTRVMADLPTSRVASAAQGYVELHGQAPSTCPSASRSSSPATSPSTPR